MTPFLTDIVMEKEREQANDHNNASRSVAGLIVDCRARSPDDVANEHTDTTPGKQRTPTESVHEESGSTKGISLSSQVQLRALSLTLTRRRS